MMETTKFRKKLVTMHPRVETLVLLQTQKRKLISKQHQSVGSVHFIILDLVLYVKIVRGQDIMRIIVEHHLNPLTSFDLSSNNSSSSDNHSSSNNSNRYRTSGPVISVEALITLLDTALRITTKIPTTIEEIQLELGHFRLGGGGRSQTRPQCCHWYIPPQ